MQINLLDPTRPAAAPEETEPTKKTRGRPRSVKAADTPAVASASPNLADQFDDDDLIFTIMIAERLAKVFRSLAGLMRCTIRKPALPEAAQIVAPPEAVSPPPVVTHQPIEATPLTPPVILQTTASKTPEEIQQAWAYETQKRDIDLIDKLLSAIGVGKDVLLAQIKDKNAEWVSLESLPQATAREIIANLQGIAAKLSGGEVAAPK